MLVFSILSITLLGVVELPVGAAPAPVPFDHFPDRLHAYVWMNWTLVPMDRLAEAIGARPVEVVEIGRRMGLPVPPPVISAEKQRRSYITVIRRNWHLLPYEQLLKLLDWTPDQLAYTLREDDFLFIKLGSLKPDCAPLRYTAPTNETIARAENIGRIVNEYFPNGLMPPGEPLFAFVQDLSRQPIDARSTSDGTSHFSPRYCSSYFMMYGDPFLETDAESYPDGYLARLKASGVDGVWLHSVLYKMTPFPWDEKLSERYEERLANLKALVARAKAQGIGIYLYMNEPRAMPLSFHEAHPGLRGVTVGDHATLCTSVPEVQDYLRSGVARICRAVPDLAGFFTITASENLTSCWSHHRGKECPRCADRGPHEVIAEVNRLIQEGIAEAGTKTRLIAWDWGWPDDAAPGIIERLPQEAALMSVSEWSIPIQRGGIDTIVGEYSISTVGPGPRATRHWELARERDLKTLAKVQAGNTWEISAVPYIPALENVAEHAARLRKAGVDGLMLGWTLGGYPSPNLEVFAEMGYGEEAPDIGKVLRIVAERRFGAAAPEVVKAWRAFSAAFREYPYHIGTVYSGPQQMGPANPIWAQPTGYTATMVGFPYDDLDRWRSVYPAEIFTAQFEKMAAGFETALSELRKNTEEIEIGRGQRALLEAELHVAEACAIHFRSVANQCSFVLARRVLESPPGNKAAMAALDAAERALRSDLDLAVRLFHIQNQDSRIGFEATNHYFYIPLDLAAKVINCRDLLDRWILAQRALYQ